MITDETLGVTATFTTAKGAVLAKRTSPDLTIIDTSYGPQTYDIYVDKDRGGDNIATELLADGVTRVPIKKPLSLFQLFKAQHPNRTVRDRDTFNLHVAANVAVVGDRKAATANAAYFEEFRNSPINLDNAIDQLMINTNGNIFQDPYTKIEEKLWRHSQGQHVVIDTVLDISFNKRYGRFYLTYGAYHGWGTLRLVVYNADASIASDQTLVPYASFLNVLKGQYAKLYIKYTPGSIDSKNDAFMWFQAQTINGNVPPALLIGGAFNKTNTINIYNNGYIIGKGGDGDNYTPPAYSSDWWQTPIYNVVTEDFTRNNTGGDAILSVDVKAINIYNNGIIAGGGGAPDYGYSSQKNGNATYYTAPGGAPFGLGTVTYSRYSAGGTGGVLPFITGPQAGFMTPAPGGANIGQSIYNTNTTSSVGYTTGFAGMYYRGCRDVNFYGSGQYIGPNCLSTQLGTMIAY